MNKDMLNALLVWGDRANRDTSHLMDIVIAGTIEQLVGHGTVVLRPAKLEEIISRIAKRERDPDGGWRVTLLPDADGTPAANTERTSAEVASIAARVLAAGNPLDNDQVILALISGVAAANSLEEAKAAVSAVLGFYMENMMSLAGSALTQRG